MSGSAPRITLTDTGGTDDYAKIFSSSGALYFQQRDGSSHGEIIFRTENNSTATERMRIKSDGNVGVGINSPTGKFAVSDGTVIGEINPYSSSATCFIGTRSNHSITFKTNASGHATLSTSGDFMVGTTSNASSNGVGLKLNYGSTNPTFNLSLIHI